MMQRYLFLLTLSLAMQTQLHAAQMNVEVKEQEEKAELTAEEQAAAREMFATIRAPSFAEYQLYMLQLQRILKQYPGIINTQGYNGNTALILAAVERRAEMVKPLIAAGADLNTQNDYGNTAIMLAPHPEILRLLIAAGADLNTQNNFGRTALMLAAWEGDTEIVRLLIAAGADATLQNEKDGKKTALDYATEHGHRNTYQAAVKAGKKERERYVKAQKESGALLKEYMIGDLAKITEEYAYNPRIPEDLPETKQSWWDKTKNLASKWYQGNK